METNNKVKNVLEETLKNLKGMIDVNSIIGNPIKQGENIIIPVSRVTVGFLSGGGEYDSKRKNLNNGYPFSGGSGGGCNIIPIGFLILYKEKVEFVKITSENNIEKIIDVVSNFIQNIK